MADASGSVHHLGELGSLPVAMLLSSTLGAVDDVQARLEAVLFCSTFLPQPFYSYCRLIFIFSLHPSLFQLEMASLSPDVNLAAHIRDATKPQPTINAGPPPTKRTIVCRRPTTGAGLRPQVASTNELHYGDAPVQTADNAEVLQGVLTFPFHTEAEWQDQGEDTEATKSQKRDMGGIFVFVSPGRLLSCIFV